MARLSFRALHPLSFEAKREALTRRRVFLRRFPQFVRALLRGDDISCALAAAARVFESAWEIDDADLIPREISRTEISRPISASLSYDTSL